MIVVFDTNVFIAAIITEGICSKILHRARLGEFSLVSCPFILREIQDILSKKFRLSPEERDAAMEPLRETVTRVVEHDIIVKGVCRDVVDDNILACALACRAEYLVTGDSDLLEIEKYEDVKIISPRNFEALLP